MCKQCINPLHTTAHTHNNHIVDSIIETLKPTLKEASQLVHPVSGMSGMPLVAMGLELVWHLLKFHEGFIVTLAKIYTHTLYTHTLYQIGYFSLVHCYMTSQMDLCPL